VSRWSAQLFLSGSWLLGLILAMFEGYFGYSLRDDLLSGIGLRAALSSVTLGMPVIGTWLRWALFGGDSPGHTIIPRMYALHVLLVPALILALVAVHLAPLWFGEHTRFLGRDEPRAMSSA
jgi:ubiquinol-cytochrome c reductase cytochrome b subunit